MNLVIIDTFLKKSISEPFVRKSFLFLVSWLFIVITNSYEFVRLREFHRKLRFSIQISVKTVKQKSSKRKWHLIFLVEFQQVSVNIGLLNWKSIINMLKKNVREALQFNVLGSPVFAIEMLHHK